jgi:hypothetical protein
MKSKRRGVASSQDEGDVWAWIVIGVIFAAVTAALYGPLIWEAAHAA